eukprot:gene34151-44125_t
MYVVYITNTDILPSLHGSPIYVAFKDPTVIYFEIIVNISTCIPTIMELIMDIKYYRDLSFENETGAGVDYDDVGSDSWIERFFLAILSIVPGSILLLYRYDANAPYIYAIVHVLQFFGSVGMVLLICKKQVPKYFRTVNIICAMILFTLGIICSIMGFGYDILHPPNMLAILFLMGGFYFLLVKMGYPWIKDVWVYSISKRKALSIEESCAMWYFMNTIVILVVVHGTVCLYRLYDWASFDSWDMNVFVYSFALYSVINSTVPGRLARIAVEKERKKMVQTKRALIRYLSHEVRSPLNVIHSGLNLLVADVESLPPSEEKETVRETFASIRHASGDLLQTMNDLLLLESMDSAAFSIQEKMVPCADLTLIADKCGVMPREKGIAFAVNNQFDAAAEEEPLQRKPDLAVEVAEHHSRDIELGPHAKEEEEEEEEAEEEAEEEEFTPPGESIAVNIRRATSVDLTEACDPGDGESEAAVDRRERVQTFTHDNGYVLCGQVLIEVKDTGVGIAPENWNKVFGQFAQFDASKLQGGGGSGLGLWICQQLVGLHGSKVRFHSDGEGRGTRFFFALPSYKKVGGSSEVEMAATAMSQQPPLSGPLSLTTRGASISPEAASSSSSSSIAPADRFARILARPLGSAGLCRVLLVDDSRVNVNVMKKMLTRVSATWVPPSAAHSDEGGEGEGETGEGKGDSSEQGGLPLPLRQNDRSSVYLFQEAIPASIPIPIPDPGGIDGKAMAV